MCWLSCCCVRGGGFGCSFDYGGGGVGARFVCMCGRPFVLFAVVVVVLDVCVVVLLLLLSVVVQVVVLDLFLFLRIGIEARSGSVCGMTKVSHGVLGMMLSTRYFLYTRCF